MIDEWSKKKKRDNIDITTKSLSWSKTFPVIFTSADVLSLEEGERGESEGDLPGELAMGGRETVDNAASSAL